MYENNLAVYYESFVSALGQSLPPHWVFQGFVALDKFLVETEGGAGGGLTHPRLQHWVEGPAT